MGCYFRVGMGYDVHKFSEGRKLWLCGIQIDHDKGLLGHSDADVAIHALCDALLGAASLRDIGYHFPDSDSRYKDADSKLLLKEVCKLLNEHGWEFGNADITICAETPKINPYIEQMVEKLAEVIQAEPESISIKATTTEKLGFTGRKEGISAYAVALIHKA